MDNIFLPIDHGNDTIKTEHFRFRAGLMQHSVRPSMAKDILVYNDQMYTLSTNRISYMRDKTQDDRYFILSLFAIAKELEETNRYAPLVEVDLSVGLPPEHYGVLRDRFADYFRRGNVKFVYNDKPYSVVIRHVVVNPQAYAVVLTLGPEILELPRVFIIDGGGYTVDVGLLVYGEPQAEFNRSLESGTIILYNEIERLVNVHHNMLVNEDQILAALQGKNTRMPEDVVQTIQKASKSHALDTLNKLREMKVELRSTPAVFMGGASQLFEQHYKNNSLVLQPTFINDPHCNVKGFAIMGREKIRRLQQST